MNLVKIRTEQLKKTVNQDEKTIDLELLRRKINRRIDIKSKLDALQLKLEKKSEALIEEYIKTYNGYIEKITDVIQKMSQSNKENMNGFIKIISKTPMHFEEYINETIKNFANIPTKKDIYAPRMASYLEDIKYSYKNKVQFVENTYNIKHYINDVIMITQKQLCCSDSDHHFPNEIVSNPFDFKVDTQKYYDDRVKNMSEYHSKAAVQFPEIKSLTLEILNTEQNLNDKEVWLINTLLAEKKDIVKLEEEGSYSGVDYFGDELFKYKMLNNDFKKVEIDIIVKMVILKYISSGAKNDELMDKILSLSGKKRDLKQQIAKTEKNIKELIVRNKFNYPEIGAMTAEESKECEQIMASYISAFKEDGSSSSNHLESSSVNAGLIQGVKLDQTIGLDI